MSLEAVAQPLIEPKDRVPRWLFVLALLGIYLTLRGYHSRDGDQAYRLPLLLHQQDPSLYQNDPFVRAFDQFNPHRGAFLVLDAVSRPFGLSVGLFLLFILTFVATVLGVDRLVRSVWPDAGASVSLLAIVLFLTAKAGNVGTNHLFESMLLDRLEAFALGWIAIATVVALGPTGSTWLAPTAIGLATLIHPSAGLQLAMTVAVAWPVWALLGRWTEVTWRRAGHSVFWLGLSVIPGLLLNAGSSVSLLSGLSPDDYWTLAVELQSPQHMLPHLWRMPQWLAWGCYFVLAGLALIGAEGGIIRPAQTRLGLMLGVVLVGLGAAWFGIEVLHDVRITVFQPFRMATIARGLALILISGHVLELWRRQDALSRLRASLISVGLIGDWLLVVVTAVELSVWGIGFVRSGRSHLDRMVQIGGLTVVLVLGIRFLSRHDTESGHIPLLATLTLVGLVSVLGAWSRIDQWTQNWLRSGRRVRILVTVAWIVPVLAIIAGLIPSGHSLAQHSMVRALVSRCRFSETPVDDIERLAAWCRERTPENSRFIGPPGPKTFRLWSRRSLAFNRASSPYHGAGLSDWFSRFRDHVGFSGSAEKFVQSYTRNRHGIESNYESLNSTQRAELASRQGATYVIAATPDKPESQNDLELLHIEGQYAVYRIRAESASGQLARSVPGFQRQR